MFHCAQCDRKFDNGFNLTEHLAGAAHRRKAGGSLRRPAALTPPLQARSSQATSPIPRQTSSQATSPLPQQLDVESGYVAFLEGVLVERDAQVVNLQQQLHTLQLQLHNLLNAPAPPPPTYPEALAMPQQLEMMGADIFNMNDFDNLL